MTSTQRTCNSTSMKENCQLHAKKSGTEHTRLGVSWGMLWAELLLQGHPVLHTFNVSHKFGVPSLVSETFLLVDEIISNVLLAMILLHNIILCAPRETFTHDLRRGESSLIQIARPGLDQGCVVCCGHSTQFSERHATKDGCLSESVSCQRHITYT